MSANKKLFMAIVVVCLMIFVVSVNPGFAYIMENGAGTGYENDDPPDGGTAVASSASIEDYIEQGVGYYLKAKEDVDALLSMVELQDTQGVDLEEMKQVVDSALTNMDNAMSTYNSLINKAESTPYNDEVISTLNGFDFNGFMMANNLNGVVLGKVEDYLKNGDITGVFERKIPIFTGMVSSLNAMRAGLDNDIIPGVSGLWELNETFSGMSLFGS
ncbi:MAG: hypothetical protein GY940_29035, partial [bacterium]|nr:hypothetical protein [bacterium]